MWNYIFPHYVNMCFSYFHGRCNTQVYKEKKDVGIVKMLRGTEMFMLVMSKDMIVTQLLLSVS